MSWVAVAATAVSVGVSAYEYASAPGPPKPPNLAQATRTGTEAEAASLPQRLAMESAAQQGTNYGAGRYAATQMTRAQVAAQLKTINASLKKSPHDVSLKEQQTLLSEARKGMGGHPDATTTLYQDSNGQFAAKDVATADFTGYGEADVKGAVAKGQAANQLALEQKYGSKFIAEALKERELADPQGVAARAREQELIQQEISDHPDRPVASLLDQQVADQLKAGKGLDNISDNVLREAVAKAQADRGAEGGTPNFAEPLTTGAAGQARLTAAEQTAGNWLASGATPEDVAYRREQQNLQNLGAFVNGTTPESQFQNLSGAQQGPAPFLPGQQRSSNNPNAGPQNAAAAMAGWGTQLNQAENTANPWMAGLSAVLKGAGAVGNAGYKPLG